MAGDEPGINTGGGAYFESTVSSGRDLIGRDKIVHGDEVGVSKGLAAAELAQVFQAVYQQIEAPLGPRSADTDELAETVRRLEREAGKGDEASTQQVERWLGMLSSVAPDVFEVAVNALTNPAALVSSAVRLVARQLQQQSA
jgi:hypothetical protein